MSKLQFKETEVGDVIRDLKSIGYTFEYRVGFKDSSLTPNKDDLERFGYIERMLASGNVSERDFDKVFPGLTVTIVTVSPKTTESDDAYKTSFSKFIEEALKRDELKKKGWPSGYRERPVTLMGIYPYGTK